MLIGIIFILSGILIIRIMLHLFGFALKAAFWLVIGIPVAIFLFACGLVVVGVVALIIAIVGGIAAAVVR